MDLTSPWEAAPTVSYGSETECTVLLPPKSVIMSEPCVFAGWRARYALPCGVSANDTSLCLPASMLKRPSKSTILCADPVPLDCTLNLPNPEHATALVHPSVSWTSAPATWAIGATLES